MKIGIIKRFFLALITYLFLAASYAGTSYWTDINPALVVYTSLEAKIPFLPVFVYGYIFGYIILLALPIFIIADRQKFLDYLLGITWIIFTSSIVYLILPTTTLRPTVQGVDITTKFLNVLHKVDQPNNCFPSLHVSLTMFAGLFLHRHTQTKIWPVFLALLVAVSTILTKQHAVIDVAGGFIMALLGIWHFGEHYVPGSVLPLATDEERRTSQPTGQPDPTTVQIEEGSLHRETDQADVS